MAQDSFTLKELCSAAEVTERTVRFYIKEGLLPPPAGSGPFSRYNREHLLRLQFIRRLKSEYLPLSEIKRLLQGRSTDELERLAGQIGLESSGAGSEPGGGASEPAPERDRLGAVLGSAAGSAAARLRRQPAARNFEVAGADLHDRPVQRPVMAESSPQYGSPAAAALESSRPDEPEAHDWTAMPVPLKAAYSPPLYNPVAARQMPAAFQPEMPAAPAELNPVARQAAPLRRPEVDPLSVSRLSLQKPELPPEAWPQGQTWERLVIGPGAELHLESRLAGQRRAELADMIEFLRQWLAGESE